MRFWQVYHDLTLLDPPHPSSLSLLNLISPALDAIITVSDPNVPWFSGCPLVTAGVVPGWEGGRGGREGGGGLVVAAVVVVEVVVVGGGVPLSSLPRLTLTSTSTTFEILSVLISSVPGSSFGLVCNALLVSSGDGNVSGSVTPVSCCVLGAPVIGREIGNVEEGV